jgi:PLP dependent protein
MSLERDQVTDSVAGRLAELRAEIAAAAAKAKRDPASVKLVAVTKTVPALTIEQAIAAGQRMFGENRVQEAKSKYPPLKALHPDLELHLIGPLQSNKVDEAVALVDVIESVDRPKIARALSQEIARQGKRPRLFVQVNTGEEAQKAGIAPRDTDRFVAQCRDEFGLGIDGLMCIPPFHEEPSPHFALLANIAQRLGLKELSMGMSGDFAKAVLFGATYVRVGTVIFGGRPSV